MKVFTLLWAGHVVSMTGSGLTRFALGVWVYQQTSSATLFGLILLFGAIPGILALPVAGVLADTWSRRWLLVLSNTAAAASTAAVVALLRYGDLRLWHIYVLVAVSSALAGVSRVVFETLTTTLVDRKHWGRASGMVQSGQAVAMIVSPLLAGVLMVSIELHGIFLIDIATFLFATLPLLVLRLPESRPAGRAGVTGSFWGQVAYGWTYISRRPGLWALLAVFASLNLAIGITQALLTPLVLSLASPDVLGVVFSMAGVGTLLGGTLMAAWGGPRRRVDGVLGAALLFGLCLVLAGLWPSVAMLTAACFGIGFSAPIANACNQLIWQARIAPGEQGRVFATRTMIAWSSGPLGYLVAGPLADHVFEPLLAVDGMLAGSLGVLLGTGPGRGIGLLFAVMGLLTVVGTLLSYQVPSLQGVEDDLPDVLPDPEPAVQAPRGAYT